MPYKHTKYPLREELSTSQNPTDLIEEEVKSLLQKEAICLCFSSIEGFFPSPQVEWSDGATNQPVTSEQAGRHSTLQDGEYANHKGPIGSRTGWWK